LDVSVIIPVYNAEKYLRQAVESVLAERHYGVKEIIIVEDGSLDNSLKVAQQLKNKFPEIIHLYQHPNGINRGAGASRNLGIKKATGDLVCFLDADDYWLPGRLAEPIEILKLCLDIDGIYAPARYIFEGCALRSEVKNMPEFVGSEMHIAPENLLEAVLSGVHVCSTNGLIVRKSCFDKIGYYNEDLRRAQDMELFLRMAARLRMVRTKSGKPVDVIRRHGQNRWKPGPEYRRDLLENACAAFESLHRWLLYNPVKNRYRVLILKRLMHHYGCLGRYKQAWDVARMHGKKWLIRYTCKYGFPGPRTIVQLIHLGFNRLFSVARTTRH
jgi:glycosyltransferase involved in cell wall biosynthesis